MSDTVKKKLTIRVTKDQHCAIEKQASDSNMSINQYIVEATINAVPHDERKLGILMGQLCRLETILLTKDDFESLKQAVASWRTDTITYMR